MNPVLTHFLFSIFRYLLLPSSVTFHPALRMYAWLQPPPPRAGLRHLKSLSANQPYSVPHFLYATSRLYGSKVVPHEKWKEKKNHSFDLSFGLKITIRYSNSYLLWLYLNKPHSLIRIPSNEISVFLIYDLPHQIQCIVSYIVIILSYISNSLLFYLFKIGFSSDE